MRILHISGAYIPSRRASSVAVMKMCSALASNGHELRAIVKEGEASDKDPFEFYGVPRTFELSRLKRPARRGGAVVLLGEQVRELLMQRKWADLVYARDVLAAASAAALGYRVIYESHEPPSPGVPTVAWTALMRSRRLVRLVCVTAGLAAELQKRGAKRTLTIVSPSAADPIPDEVTPALKRTPDRPIVGYVGSLYEGKGIELVVELARRISRADFVVIGGRPHEIDSWRSRGLPENLKFLGFRPHGELGAYYKSLDIALLPNRRDFVGTPGGNVDISKWTSPLKMLEYMSSGAAIVASNLEVLGEVLQHERNALIANVENPDEWERATNRLIDDHELARRLASEAKADLLASYTWKARAELVLREL